MPKLTEQEIRRIHAELYIKKGMPLDEIDEEKKWYKGCTRYHFKRLGLNIRRPGPPKSNVSIKKILSMKKKGMTDGEIAEELKLGTRQAVSMRIKRHKERSEKRFKKKP